MVAAQARALLRQLKPSLPILGNAFSATPSGAWIPSVIAGDTGIPFSVRLESFVLTPNHANQLAPGKRPRVTLSPTLVTYADGRQERRIWRLTQQADGRYTGQADDVVGTASGRTVPLTQVARRAPGSACRCR